MKQEFILYCIVMSFVCVPAFMWIIIRDINKNRQIKYGEKPEDQIGCGQMILVTLARLFLAVFPLFLVMIFFNLWAEWLKNPDGNPLFILYTVIMIVVGAGVMKAGSVLKGN